MNKAVAVAPKSNIRITNFGTTLKFLIVNIGCLNSINWGALKWLINYAIVLRIYSNTKLKKRLVQILIRKILVMSNFN
jgi:hypothetical protein